MIKSTINLNPQKKKYYAKKLVLKILMEIALYAIKMIIHLLIVLNAITL
jgi:hypothetical protein